MEATDKASALEMINSLSKKFQIKNNEILQYKKSSSVNSDKVIINSLSWKEKLKFNGYITNILPNISGTRYYYGWGSYIIPGYNNNNAHRPDQNLCGYYNTVNLNKPGYTTKATASYQDLNCPSPGKNTTTYWRFTRFLTQDSKQSNIVINGTMTYYQNITEEVTYVETTVASKSIGLATPYSKIGYVWSDPWYWRFQ